MKSFETFITRDIAVNGTTIHTRIYRHPDPASKAVLLLHGFPQTHVCWHRVAPELTQHYSVICPDLRGYGDSDKPQGLPDHANYSKATMAQDMAELMDVLGFERFHMVGHDRGARVAHRLALDHAARVERLCLIDVSPTLTMYQRTTMAFASAYFHWFFLIQPAPFPETLLAADAPNILRTFLGGWGAGGLAHYAPEALAEYERCWCTPVGLHGSCEDYRASAGIDLEHDRDSDLKGRKIASPLLVVWGQNGVVNKLFKPLEDWTEKSAASVTGKLLPTGHFIPEEAPDLLLAELLPFLAA